MTIRNDAGAPVGTGTIVLNALGHTSFVLSTQFPPTANIRGTVEFDAPGFGRRTPRKSACSAFATPAEH